MKKRITAMLLSLAMVFSLLPGTALAAVTNSGGSGDSTSTDPHPTEEQLAALGYSFASDYKITGNEHWVNGTKQTPPLSINVLRRTDSDGKTYTVLFMSIYGRFNDSNDPYLKVGPVNVPSDAKDVANPNYGKMETGAFTSADLQVDCPQSVDDLYVDSDGHIYYIFNPKIGSDTTPRTYYLGTSGFTTETSDLPTVTPTKGKILIWSTRTKYETFNGTVTTDHGGAVPKMAEIYEDHGYTVEQKLNKGSSGAQHFTPSTDDLSTYDMVVLWMPSVALTADDLTVLNAYLSAGGRILMQGENPNYAADQNGNLSSAAQSLGATFTITKNGATKDTKELNPDSRLSQGVSSLAPSAVSEVSYSGTAQWVAKIDGKAWIVDQVAGINASDSSKNGWGRVTVFADLNFYSDNESKLSGTQYKQLLWNLLDDSKANMEMAAKGVNPNADFGKVTNKEYTIDPNFTGTEGENGVYKTIEAAYAAAKTAGVGAAKFVLAGDVVQDKKLSFNDNINVTITSKEGGEGAPYSIIRKFGTVDADDGADLIYQGSGSLTLENVTLDGNYDGTKTAAEGATPTPYYGGMLTVSGGTATLGEGASITNASTGTASNGANKAIVSAAYGGTFNLDGGSITDNKTAGSGDSWVIYISSQFNNNPDSTVNLKSGEISGNEQTHGVHNAGTLNYTGGTITDTICVTKGHPITLADGWTAPAETLNVVAHEGATEIVDGNNRTGDLEGLKDKITCNNGDDELKVDNGKIVIDNSGAVRINVKDGDLTDLKKSGSEYTYKLGNARVTGSGAKTFEIGVDTGYFTVDTTAAPTGCTFYASLTAGGALTTTGTPKPGSNYTYLQFKCGNNVLGSALRDYLREHVTFHRPARVEQTVTVVAENVALPTGTEAFMGHYYQFEVGASTNWSGAYAGAKGKTFNGLTGYLLNVNDKNEHNYIYQKFGKNGWMGATRAVPTGSYDQASFAYGNTLNWVWKWAGGPEAGQTIGTQPANRTGMSVANGAYTNWTPGEPNGRGVPGYALSDEGFGQYGYRSGGCWNDLPDRGSISGIQGYYVEYGGYESEALTTPRAMDTRTVTDPASGEALTVTGGAVENGKTSLTVGPTSVGRKYAVVDADGKVVQTTGATAWTVGNGGELTFGGLEPGKVYHIVSVPQESNTEADQGVVDANGGIASWPSNETVQKDATVVAPVAPTTSLPNTTREGATIKVPEATDTAKDYALADSQGNLVTDWTVGATAGLTFTGLDPDETYTLVESGHVDTTSGTTKDPVRLFDTEKAPKILPVPAAEDMTGAYDAGTQKSSLTIDPAQAGLTYTATPKNEDGSDGTPIQGAVKTEGGVTTVTFPGLEPGGEYEISVSDGTATTKGPTVKAPVAISDTAPQRTETEGSDPATDTVTLPAGSTGTDKVYALVDANGNFINQDGTYSDTPVWIAGTGENGAALTWTGLDPDGTYHVLTADKDGSTTAPAANAVPAETPVYPMLNAEEITVTVDPETGKGALTFGPANPGDKYTVDGVEQSVPVDGMLTVSGLQPGKEVNVTGPGSGGNTAKVTVPAVAMGQLSGAVDTKGTANTTDDDTASVTVKPTVQGVNYAVVDDSGKLVTDSKSGNGGALTFEGLTPGTGYKVVALASPKTVGDGDGNKASDDEMKSAVPIVTPTAPVAPDKVKREESTNSKDKITVKDSDNGLEYAVIDKATGLVVAPAPGLSDTDSDGWVTGNSGDLVFDGLDPDKTYEVVTRKPAADDGSAPAGLPSQGVAVLPRDSAPTADKVSGKLGGDGKWSTVVADSDSNTKYAVVDKDTGKVIAPLGGGNGDGWVTGNGGKLELGPLPAGDYVVVAMPKSDNDGEDPGNDTEKNDLYPSVVAPSAGAPTVTIPVLSPEQLTGSVAGEGESAKATITIQPADSDLCYGLKDEDGNAVGDWKTPAGGKVTFEDLTPGKTYQVVTVPADQAGNAQVKDAAGQDVVVPVLPVTAPKADGSYATEGGAANQVKREVGGGADAATDTVTVKTESGYSYALVDEDGKYYTTTGGSGSDTENWTAGDGNEKTWSDLPFGKKYQVRKVPTGAVGGTGLKTDPITIPAVTDVPILPGVVDSSSLKTALESSGEASLTIQNTDTAFDYIVADEAGKVVAVEAGNGGSVTVKALLPGTTYKVMTRAKSGGDTLPSVGDSITPSARVTEATTPMLSVGKEITAEKGSTAGKAKIVISPASDQVKYVLVADGSVVETKPGANGKVVFDNLDANKEYHVVTISAKENDPSSAPATNGENSVALTTPKSGDAGALSAAEKGLGDVKKTHSSITIPNSDSTVTYIVLDKDGNEVAAEDGNGGDLTFDGLVSGTQYQVFAKDKGTSNAVPVILGNITTASSNSDPGGGTGGSSSSSNTSVAVKVNSGKGGTVTVTPSSPKSGEKVTITVKPDQGKTVERVVVTDKTGKAIAVTDNGDGTYSYVQPERKLAPVTVSVTYKDVTGAPGTNGVSELLITEEHIAFMQGDNFGLFRPQANITRAEAAQMFYNLLRNKEGSEKADFADVPSDQWYAPAVQTLAGLGIANGVGNGYFAPDRAITRAEFVTIAARFASRTSGSITFTDVEADYWAYDKIGQAVYYGWINGYEDNTFRPENPISRAEAAKVVNAMLGRSADQSFVDKAEGLRLFPDVEKTFWAFYEIVEATNTHDFLIKDNVERWGR